MKGRHEVDASSKNGKPGIFRVLWYARMYSSIETMIPIRLIPILDENIIILGERAK